MIGLVLAAALGTQAPEITPRSGEWVILDVMHVIAPEQLRGQCFVQGRVERVMLGTAYQPGQAVNLSVACIKGPGRKLIPLQATRAPSKPEPLTVERLQELKRALVHLDRKGQLVNNEYYSVGAQPLR